MEAGVAGDYTTQYISLGRGAKTRTHKHQYNCQPYTHELWCLATILCY